MADSAPFQFDLTAARADGVSDADIAAFLAPQVGFDLNAARRDGVSDSAIVEFLSPAPAGPPAPAAPAPKKASILDDVERGFRSGQSAATGISASIIAGRLSALDKANEKIAAGEPMGTWERRRVDRQNANREKAERLYAERTGASVDYRKQAADLPISPEYKAFNEADGFVDSVKAFWRAPVK